MFVLLLMLYGPSLGALVSSNKQVCPEPSGDFPVPGTKCTREYNWCDNGVPMPMTCDAGLLFDPRLGACNLPCAVEGCDSSKKESGFQCPGKNGKFSASTVAICSSKYYFCYEGCSMELFCAEGEIFNPWSGTCDFPEFVVGCKHLGDPPFNCTGKRNQMYAHRTCSQWFSWCWDGVPARLHCPRGLYFNEIQQYCDYPSNIQGCENSTIMPVKNVTRTGFNCEGRDGNFADPKASCSGTFFSCTQGSTTSFEQRCPDGLKYDVDGDRCDLPEFVPACGGKTTTAQPFVQSQTPAGITFDCRGKPDGSRFSHPSEPCNNSYVECSQNKPVPRLCPANLFFSQTSQNCEFKEHVPSCGGEPLTPNPADKENDSPPAPTLPPGVVFDCRGKTDGSKFTYPGQPCNSAYIECVNNNVYVRSCPSDLVFSAANDNCEFRSNIGDCVGVAAPSTVASVLSQPSYCAGKKPNSYSLGRCKSYYIICGLGNLDSTVQQCPFGSIFDSQSSVCVSPSQSPECGASKTNSDVVSLATTAGISGPSTPATSTVASNLPPDTSTDFCSNKADGKYPTGTCSRVHIRCRYGNGVSELCPGTMVFNGLRSVCDERANVEECPQFSTPSKTISTSPRTTERPPVTIRTTPAVNFDATTKGFCGSNADGDYPAGQCSDVYVTCSGGQTMVRRCAASLKFAPLTKRCDHPSFIPSCGGIRENDVSVVQQQKPSITASVPPPKTSPLPVTPETTSTTLSPEGQKFCSDKENGDYATADCSEIFVSCSEQQFIQRSCSHGLKFDPEGLICEHPDAIVSCGGKPQPLPMSSVAPPASVIPEAHGSQTAPPVIASTEGFCSNHMDGDYPTGPCSNVFVTCSNGHSIARNCPPGLVFDAVMKVCSDFGEISACDSQPPPKMPQPSVTPSLFPPVPTRPMTTQGPTRPIPVMTTQGSSPLPPVPTRTAPMMTTQGFCDSRQNGNYPVQLCSNSFVTCTDGKIEFQSCPGGLMFDVRQKECGEPTTIPACGGIPTTQRAPPMPSREPPTMEATSAPGQSGSEDLCYNKPNGDYSTAPCANTFVSCTEGHTVNRFCPPGLVFDDIMKSCSDAMDIPVCLNADVPSSTAILHVATTPLPSTTAGFCGDRENGDYATRPCSDLFITCTDGNAVFRNCPVGLKFDGRRKMCDNVAMIEACGQGLQRPPAQVRPIQPQRTLPTTELPSSTPAGFCGSRPNGNYATGPCSGNFVVCSEGNTIFQSCPAGLKFDAILKICDEDAMITACGVGHNQKPTQSQTLPPVATTAKIPIKPKQTPPPTVPTPARPEGFCGSRPNGNYATGPCSGNFVACSEGNTIFQSCPAGLKFDAILKICDEDAMITACGVGHNQKPTQSQTLPPVATTPKIPIKPKQTPPPTVPTPAPEGFCNSRANGNYPSSPCSDKFVACSEGHTIFQSCPAGLKFDPVKLWCDEPTSITGCGVRTTQNQQPLTTPSKPVSSTFLPPVREGLAVIATGFCDNRPNGEFPTGPCSERFVSCSEGRDIQQFCPAGLKFNSETKVCDEPAQISGCGAAQRQTVKPMQTQSTVVHEKLTMQPSSNVFCADKPNGDYESASCSETYITCSEYQDIKRSCPPGLKFDGSRQICDNTDSVLSCGSFPTVPAVTNSINNDVATALPAVQELGPNIPQEKPQSHFPTQGFCSRHSNGDYATGPCNGVYVTCAEGRQFRRNCPSGTVFDPTTKVCGTVFEIKGCGAIPVTTVSYAPETIQSTTKPYYSTLPYQPPKEMYPVPTSSVYTTAPYTPMQCNSGAVRSAGICIDKYLLCISGHWRKQVCFDGEAFDFLSGKCHPRSMIRGCQPPTVNPPATTPKFQLPPVNVEHNPSASLVNEPQELDHRYCHHGHQLVVKRNGHYAFDHCSDRYYVCQNGKVSFHHCAKGKIFDKVSQSCISKHHHPSCGDNKGIKTVEYDVPESPFEELDGDAFCEKKRDGFYVAPYDCDRRVFVCFEGDFGILECPVGTVYSQEKEDCVRQKHCDHVKGTPDIMPGNDTAYHITEGKISDAFCKDRSCGFHPYGNCDQRIRVCFNGRMDIQHCPPHKVFSTEEGRCVHKSLCRKHGKEEKYSPIERGQVVESQVLMSDKINWAKEMCPKGYNGLRQIENCIQEYVMCHGSSPSVSYHKSNKGKASGRRSRRAVKRYRSDSEEDHSYDSEELSNENKDFKIQIRKRRPLKSRSIEERWYSSEDRSRKSISRERNYGRGRRLKVEVRRRYRSSGSRLRDESRSYSDESRSSSNEHGRGFKVEIRRRKSSFERSEPASFDSDSYSREHGGKRMKLEENRRRKHNFEDGDYFSEVLSSGDEYLNRVHHSKDFPKGTDGIGYSEDFSSELPFADSNAELRRCTDGKVFDGQLKLCVAPEQCLVSGVKSFKNDQGYGKPSHGYPAAAAMPYSNSGRRDGKGIIHGKAAPYSKLGESDILDIGIDGKVGQPYAEFENDYNGLVVDELDDYNVDVGDLDYSGSSVCLNKHRGPHAIGHCNRQYFTCHKDHVSFHKCSHDNEYFDKRYGECRPKPHSNQCHHDRKPDEICLEKHSGSFAVDACNRNYFICHNYHVSLHQCHHHHEYFSEQHQRCRPMAENLRCRPHNDDESFETTAFCSGRPDGKYQLYACGQKYVRCKLEAAVTRYCAGGNYFDEKLQACRSMKHSERCGSEKHICRHRHDGLYPVATCSAQYVACERHHTTKLSCLKGFVFDDRKQRCATPLHVPQCTNFKALPYPPMKDISAVSDDICNNAVDGTISAATCATVYTICMNTRSVQRHCKAGEVFSSTYKKCVKQAFDPECFKANLATNNDAPVGYFSSSNKGINTDGSYHAPAPKYVNSPVDYKPVQAYNLPKYPSVINYTAPSLSYQKYVPPLSYGNEVPPPSHNSYYPAQSVQYNVVSTAATSDYQKPSSPAYGSYSVKPEGVYNYETTTASTVQTEYKTPSLPSTKYYNEYSVENKILNNSYTTSRPYSYVSKPTKGLYAGSGTVAPVYEYPKETAALKSPVSNYGQQQYFVTAYPLVATTPKPTPYGPAYNKFAKPAMSGKYSAPLSYNYYVPTSSTEAPYKEKPVLTAAPYKPSASYVNYKPSPTAKPYTPSYYQMNAYSPSGSKPGYQLPSNYEYESPSPKPYSLTPSVYQKHPYSVTPKSPVSYFGYQRPSSYGYESPSVRPYSPTPSYYQMHPYSPAAPKASISYSEYQRPSSYGYEYPSAAVKPQVSNNYGKSPLEPVNYAEAAPKPYIVQSYNHPAPVPYPFNNVYPDTVAARPASPYEQGPQYYSPQSPSARPTYPLPTAKPTYAIPTTRPTYATLPTTTATVVYPEVATTSYAGGYAGPSYETSKSKGELGGFCGQKSDGYYRHPTDCSKFVQCFHGDTYILNCAAGTVYNPDPAVGTCDFPQNVPDCQLAELPTGGDKDPECLNQPHGAFLRHPSDCRKYIRCVWNKKVEMECPDDTLFNMRLNVCDHPNAVPECHSEVTNVASVPSSYKRAGRR